jgi:Xaa-Pro aminopeptidase
VAESLWTGKYFSHIRNDMLLSKIPNYFKERRDQLMKSHPGSVFLFPSAPHWVRNNDVHFPFRQESNFFYLTGLEEAESFLILAPLKSNPVAYRMILFVLPRDPEKEMWEGERYGLEGALEIFGADEAYSSHEFEKRLPEILEGSEQIFYRMGVNPALDRRIVDAIEVYRSRQGRSGKSMLPILDPTEAVGEMRILKSSSEIELMRKACDISSAAHRAAMIETRPGMNEGAIEALIDYHFRRGGCQRVGYGSIVASGKNSTCLHYRSNNEVLKDGDLLLIDAGGEYEYYSADITRTFPVGKEFTPAQAKAYDLVLKAQKEAIAMTRPGVKLPDIHRHVCQVMIDGLLSMGLLKGKPEEIFRSGEYKRFYPHNTSHWLGMDVHDAGLYQKAGDARPLEAGMVFTIEPGFYVQPSDRQAPSEYRNIGIRIEDDILVTETGFEVLTSKTPKERVELEALKA